MKAATKKTTATDAADGWRLSSLLLLFLLFFLVFLLHPQIEACCGKANFVIMQKKTDATREKLISAK